MGHGVCKSKLLHKNDPLALGKQLEVMKQPNGGIEEYIIGYFTKQDTILKDKRCHFKNKTPCL